MKLQTSLQCKKCVSRAVIIASAKSLAGIKAKYNLHVQKLVSFHSFLVSEDTNMRTRCYLCPSEKDRKSKISYNDCQQSICSEHSVNFCLQCKKLDTFVMFRNTFSK